MKKEVLPKETIETLVEIGEVLRRINARMNAEGFEIKDGKVVAKNLPAY